MSYALVQAVWSTGSGTTGTASPSSVGAGHLLILAGTCDSTSTAVIASTTQGDSFNVLKFYPAESAWSLYCFARGGETTISLTTNGTNLYDILCVEYSGISSFIGANDNYQGSSTPGANVLVSGNVNITPVPAMLWGFSTNISNNSETPSAGTSPIVFNGYGNASYLNDYAEDVAISSSGNAQVTFGTMAAGDSYITIAAAFAQTGAGGGGGANLFLLGV